MELRTLKDFVAAFYQTQRQRIRAGNMLYASKRELILPYLEIQNNNSSKANQKLVDERYEELKSSLNPSLVNDIELRKVELYDDAFSREKRLEKIIRDDIEDRPLYTQWLSCVRGVGHLLTASFMSYIYDIGRFDTISKLWQYSGYGIMAVSKVDGITKRWFPTRDEALEYVDHEVALEAETAEKWGRKYDAQSKTSAYMDRCVWGIKHEHQIVASKPISGLPSRWHPDLKATGWKFSESIQKQSADKSKYRQYYDSVKEYYTKKHGDERSKGHINNMTKRKVAKLFLSHLWTQWRKVEGLPVSKPYAIEHMEHNDYIAPFYDIETGM